MIVEACAVACELGLAAASAMADVAATVVLASARPWRYLASRSFRQAENERMRGLGRLRRCVHFAWGSLALAAGVALVMLGANIVTQWAEEQATAREQARREAVETVKEATARIRHRPGR